MTTLTAKSYDDTSFDKYFIRCTCTYLQCEYPAAVLAQVKVLENVKGGRGDAREVDLVRRVLARPVTRREDPHGEVDTVHVLVDVGEVVLELVIYAVGSK